MPLDSISAEIDVAWERHNRERFGERWERRKVRARLAEAQNWRCCYCGVRMKDTPHDPASATLEAIVPKSRGGNPFDVDNLAVACLQCNLVRDQEIWPVHIETIVAMTASALRMSI
jgi:hypothetical protein